MATTIIKGVVKDILPIEHYGEGNVGRRQTLVVFVPGYVDQYGEKKAKDEEWGVDIYNARIEHFALNSNCISKKADVEVYLTGRRWQTDEKSGYSVSVTLKSIQLGDAVQIDGIQPPTDDDLPF